MFINNLQNSCFINGHVYFPAQELLKTSIAKAGYTDKIVIGMDVAASEFYQGGKYDLDFKSPDDPSRYISPDQLADLYKSFVKDYPGLFPSTQSSPLLPTFGSFCYLSEARKITGGVCKSGLSFTRWGVSKGLWNLALGLVCASMDAVN